MTWKFLTYFVWKGKSNYDSTIPLPRNLVCYFFYLFNGIYFSFTLIEIQKRKNTNFNPNFKLLGSKYHINCFFFFYQVMFVFYKKTHLLAFVYYWFCAQLKKFAVYVISQTILYIFDEFHHDALNSSEDTI